MAKAGSSENLSPSSGPRFSIFETTIRAVAWPAERPDGAYLANVQAPSLHRAFAGPRPASREGGRLMVDWPSYKTARDLAGTVFPVSENVIHQHARKYGLGRKMVGS